MSMGMDILALLFSQQGKVKQSKLLTRLIFLLAAAFLLYLLA